MFDLTKQIKLDHKLQIKYNAARAILHLAFIIVALFAIDRILLPIASQDFYFNSIGSTKNTLGNPRVNGSAAPSNGAVAPNDTLSFNASRMGIFSSATTTLTTATNFQKIQGTNISIRKSYQAFFYPIGDPVGFRNGTLLTTDDGSYYIVSGDTLRKFANTDIILQFCYPKSSFLTVTQKDLQYNPSGPDIASSNTYPDGSLFVIAGIYYQLKNQQLLPFISERAFLSQYDAIQAIPKNQDFFASYPASETSLGFADGTLASSDASVFILSGGKSYPIANAETFVSMGFNWNDVLALQPEELGLYEQQKQFNDSQPHPDGTLFVDQKTNEYFLIENGEKRPIKSLAIIKTYAKQKPIIADQQSLLASVSCKLKAQMLTEDTFSCAAPLQSINQFPGNYYQIDAKFLVAAKISQMNVTLSTPPDWQHIHASLGNIKNTLKTNYTQQP